MLSCFPILVAVLGIRLVRIAARTCMLTYQYLCKLNAGRQPAAWAVTRSKGCRPLDQKLSDH